MRLISSPTAWACTWCARGVLGLPRTDRRERVVGIEHLDRAVDIPFGGGAHGGVEDSTVFVDGDGSVGVEPTSKGEL